MTRYIKFENNTAIEAPSTIVKGGKQILGYNKPSNEAMLLADGYMKYEGDGKLEDLILVNGHIEVDTNKPFIVDFIGKDIQKYPPCQLHLNYLLLH